MGVQVRIVLYAPEDSTAKAAARAAFHRIAELEDVMSDYRPTSELMRLSARSGSGPVSISEDLYAVLDRAQQLARLSEGAFDVTVGPLVQLWRQARRSGALPHPDTLRAARARVGWQHLHLDPAARTARLDVPGMQLDLGGIAKGYAIEEAVKVLQRHGIDRALIELGGDFIVSGPPPGAPGWQLQILHAAPDKQEVTLTYTAISSSGDTEQFVEVDGRRYSHVVDPRTGLGLTNRIAVTVIAPSATLTDALATMLSTLGPARGLPLLAEHFPAAAAYIRYADEVPE